ncbi:hypothetical protein GCM10011416_00080 [Polaribacter pacificus]|uniref:Uncharacterized protein n=1 Tax=Polaribacter pacificus TaxID=1775173 RepID=A0A917HRA7_9FLAO|nr:hypothetical protein [Polaribacter pacificus]GGG87858.1 hypothetical protein GCM10011416_00080 [Polaribacter pacificus]
MQPLVNYEHDSEIVIIQKRSFKELDIWISDINFSIEECDYLAKIASNKLKDSALRDEFLDMIHQSMDLLSNLQSFRNATENLSECTDLECDLVFLNEHEEIRLLYLNHLKKYRSLKKKAFTVLLK